MNEGAEKRVDQPTRDGRLPGWLATYLIGLAMGTADAVPGVSGGTIALIAGIYDRLVGAIAAFDPGQISAAGSKRSTRPIADLLVEMDVRFLLALGLGMVTGVSTVAGAVEVARRTVPALMFAFFFGLIAASAVVLFEEVALDRRREQAVAILGAALAFALTGEEFRSALGNDPIVVFFAGVIAISAMILPGVSGSFLLLMLGQYRFMTAQLSEFLGGLVGLVTGGSVSDVLEPAVAVVAFCSGAVIGVLTFAKVVERALERDREATLTFLVALMVGALRLPVSKVFEHAEPTGVTVVGVLGSALIGGVLVVLLDRYTGGIGYE